MKLKIEIKTLNWNSFWHAFHNLPDYQCVTLVILVIITFVGFLAFAANVCPYLFLIFPIIILYGVYKVIQNFIKEYKEIQDCKAQGITPKEKNRYGCDFEDDY